MARKVFLRVLFGSSLLGMPFFILVSVLSERYWMTPFFVGFFIAELYSYYRWYYGSKRVKLQMRSQTQARHSYYDRWYKPADSTRLSYLKGKVGEITRRIRRRQAHKGARN